MKAERALVRLGGVATWAQLRAAVHWRHIAAARHSGAIVRTRRGRYTLPTTAPARAAAHRLTGVASHTSAALHWGWKVKAPPEQPHVTVRRKRSLAARARDGVRVHWRDLAPDEVVDGWVTTTSRTVIDCCLDLPFDEALAVFDSALRGGVQLVQVLERAARLAPRQQRRVLRVAAAADARAANPFESVLRAICLDVPGLSVTPQHVVEDDSFAAQVDLADARLQIVVEAESYEFHGSRRQFRRDCRRYTELGARGWVVLRFTWHEEMFQPDYVRRMLAMTVASRTERPERRAA
jgi:very-short-patch-repair endonuclease